MMDVTSADPQDDRVLCNPCSFHEVKVSSVTWCETCHESFCEECQKVHEGMAISKGHKTVSVDHARRTTSGSSGDSGDLCPNHPEKVMNFYCLDHKVYSCDICSVTCHSECNFENIQDVANNYVDENLVKEFIEGMNDIKTIMQNLFDIKGQTVTRIYAEYKLMIQEMESKVNEIKQMLDKLSMEFRKEASYIHGGSRGQLINDQKDIQDFIRHIETWSELIQKVSNQGTPGEIYLTFQDIRNQFSSNYLNITSKFASDEELFLKFLVDRSFMESIERMKTLGMVQRVSKPSTSIRDVISSVEDLVNNKLYHAIPSLGAQVPSTNLLTASVTFVTSKLKSDIDTTLLSGGTFLSNGHLLLSDYSKHQLFEFNENWDVVKTYEINDHPLSISQADEEDCFCVSCQHETEIQQYELKSSLVHKSSIPMQSDSYGVAICGDIVITNKLQCVDIHKPDGSFVRSIYKQESEYWGCVSASKTNETIFYKDGDGIVFRKLSGEHLFTYTNSSLVEPRGLGLDSYGNVYVCGMNSGNVHQISADGQTCRILLSKLQTIKHPWCVVVHPRKNLFVVTSNQEEVAFEVYRFNN